VPVEDMRLLIAHVSTADPEERAGAAPAASEEELRAKPSDEAPPARAAAMASLSVTCRESRSSQQFYSYVRLHIRYSYLSDFLNIKN